MLMIGKSLMSDRIGSMKLGSNTSFEPKFRTKDVEATQEMYVVLM